VTGQEGRRMARYRMHNNRIACTHNNMHADNLIRVSAGIESHEQPFNGRERRESHT
jgi:hypothetical protein